MTVPVSRAEDQALPSQKQQVTPLTLLTPGLSCTFPPFKLNVHFRGLLFERNRRNSFHRGDRVGTRRPRLPAWLGTARHPLSREPPEASRLHGAGAGRGCGTPS